METVTIPKETFQRILTHVEVLLDDVEEVLDTQTLQRLHDMKTGRIEEKTEQDYQSYLKKRGI